VACGPGLTLYTALFAKRDPAGHET
jgi:hypothetical protein